MAIEANLQLADAIFLARDATHGQDLDDWLRAERELQTSQNSSDHPP
jgi:hypothetical protein